MTNVKLISYTHPTTEMIKMGVNHPIDIVIYCARVSNPSNQTNMLTGNKLLKYLEEHKHWSPFEMVHATVEIETTRDIARQILRHRSFSFQEFSQRYADPTKIYETVEFREVRLQDSKNRQNSIEIDDKNLQKDWDNWQEEILSLSTNAYKWALYNGIAKEVARSVLPEGLIMTRLYMTGSLRSWIHYLDLREGNGTQKEHRLIAEQIRKILIPIFPILEKEKK